MSRVTKAKEDDKDWLREALKNNQPVFDFHERQIPQAFYGDINNIRDFFHSSCRSYISKELNKPKTEIKIDFLKTVNEFSSFEKAIYNTKNITLPKDLQIDSDEKILMSEDTTLNFIPPSIRDEQIEGVSPEKIAEYRQKFAEAYPRYQAAVKKIDQIKSKLLPQNKGARNNLIKRGKAGTRKYAPQPQIYQY